MYCVIQVNLTQKTARVVCTGLYGVEAKDIAARRNTLIRMPAPKPPYELVHKHRPDKVHYIFSHKRNVEDAVRRFWEEYSN